MQQSSVECQQEKYNVIPSQDEGSAVAFMFFLFHAEGSVGRNELSRTAFMTPDP
jgi:hypothetical protein